VAFDPENGWWKATSQSGQQAAGKNPREALDCLMRYTKTNTER
jgi:hypothetical protein